MRPWSCVACGARPPIVYSDDVTGLRYCEPCQRARRGITLDEVAEAERLIAETSAGSGSDGTHEPRG